MSITDLAGGHALNAQITELMGQKLYWYHEDIQAIVNEPDNRISNNGRGVYCRCQGCGINGFGNEVDWAQPCPTPVCPPYSSDIAVAWRLIDWAYEQPDAVLLAVARELNKRTHYRPSAKHATVICHAVLVALGVDTTVL